MIKIQSCEVIFIWWIVWQIISALQTGHDHFPLAPAVLFETTTVQDWKVNGRCNQISKQRKQSSLVGNTNCSSSWVYLLFFSKLWLKCFVMHNIHRTILSDCWKKWLTTFHHVVLWPCCFNSDLGPPPFPQPLLPSNYSGHHLYAFNRKGNDAVNIFFAT